MSTAWPAEVELLRALVSFPSLSGDEGEIARFVEQASHRAGLEAARDDASVHIVVQGARPGPTLAFVSHLDVVPPGEGWTRRPFDPSIEAQRLYGRGSGDAKASVAAMITAATDLAAERHTLAGKLIVILGYSEETRNTTMGQAAQRLGPIDAAIIGEPTSLDAAIAQRGLMMVDLVAHGEQRHAGRASDEDRSGNAILRLAADLVHLEGLLQEREHAILGRATITPTVLEAGVARNLTPPTAKAVLDVRSTPDWTHEEIAAVLREAMRSEVQVTSSRLLPCETPAGSALLLALRASRPEMRNYGSPTCSDWVFFRDRDVVKCGPGCSERSHRPDEWVSLDEVSAARSLYVETARRYLA